MYSINEQKNRTERTECQIFSRVCGWLVPRQSMNLGKIAEFKDRVNFKIYGR